MSAGGRSDPAVISQGLNWSAFLTSESYFELAVQHRLLAQLAFPPCRPPHCLEIAALFPRLRKVSGLPPELGITCASVNTVDKEGNRVRRQGAAVRLQGRGSDGEGSEGEGSIQQEGSNGAVRRERVWSARATMKGQ